MRERITLDDRPGTIDALEGCHSVPRASVTSVHQTVWRLCVFYLFIYLFLTFEPIASVGLSEGT